jgi:hypothetical protein
MNFFMNRGDIEEVFRIKSESIDLYGVLVAEEKGEKYCGKGIVQFVDGQTLYFSSPADDLMLARERMNSACKVIAAFYGVKLNHERF